MMSELTIIIVNYNTKKLLEKCLRSIYSSSYKDYLIWVVDNNSEDDSCRMVKSNFPKVNLIENKSNLGYSKANNQVLIKKSTDSFLLLNSDTYFKDSETLTKIVNFLKNSSFGIASGKIIYPNGKLQPNVGDFPMGLGLFCWLTGIDDFFSKLKLNLPSFHINNPNFYQKTKDVDWVSGSAMLIKKEVLDKIGYLDENLFMYAEDVDFCFRAKKAGFKVGWSGEFEIVHLSGASSKNPKFSQWLGEMRGLIYIYRKYYGVLSSLLLKLTLIFFLSLRTIAFFITGRKEVSKSYAKIIFAL